MKGSAIKRIPTWLIKDEQGQEYLDACKEAVEDDAAFAAFRTDRRYRHAVECAQPHEGQDYFDRACTIDKAFVLENLSAFQENDRFGGAPITYYTLGAVSVSTLRYIHLLTEMRQRAGPLEGMDIVEIGGGYGGQCRMIMDVCKPRSYTLFDLKWPLLLAKKYLSKYNLDECVSFREYGDFDGIGNIDVVISTWAFCELNPSPQQAYCAHVISKSRRGYTTWNTPHDWFVEYLQALNRFEVVVADTPRALIVQWKEK